MKNKIIKIGIVQTKVTDDLNFNLNHTLELVEKLARSGAWIICLQELFRTPYFPQYKKNNIEKYLEKTDGESVTEFKKISKKYGCSIIVPIYEKSKDGKYYNTAVVIDEKGKVLSYRKTHIPQDPSFYEKNYFKEGNSGYKIFKHKNIKYAVLICYDQWFPESARVVKLMGAELIFYPTAIGNIVGDKPKDGDWHDTWETVMRGHSIANSLPVVAVNRTGREGNLEFWGQSFVTDAFGKVIKKASSWGEETLQVEIDLAQNDIISKDWGFIRNRRPKTYKKIIDKNIFS